MLRVAATVNVTAAEGPFRRFALWVQGCTLRCPGCCNPEFFHPNRGTVLHDLDALGLRAAAEAGRIEGVSILGGEPLQQCDGVAALARHAQGLGLGVIVFTGYTHAEAESRPGFAELWASVDTLVDGRFDRAATDRERRFVGSTNQTLRHRTPRYAAPQLWRGRRHAEVHVGSDGLVHIHGDPKTARRIGATISLPSPPWRSPRSSSGS